MVGDNVPPVASTARHPGAGTVTDAASVPPMPHPAVPLSEEDRRRLSVLLDSYSAALTQGRSRCALSEYLSDLPGPFRAVALVELVLVDMGVRWRRGERPEVEEYLRRYPEIGPIDRIPPALILEEHLWRARVGRPARPEQYRERFPVQYPKIREQLEANMQSVQQSIRCDDSLRNQWDPGPLPPHPPTPPPSASTTDPLRGYQKLTWLGGGVFADVFRAHSPSGIEKALKIVREKITEHAGQRELKSLDISKNLRHSNLVNTHDYWIAGEQLHIVTELADGTLRERMKECQADGSPGIPVVELFVIMCGGAKGLDFLHARNFTHGDVKPDNILLLDGEPKLADFGLIRQQEAAMAQMSVFAGSPAYMAPEVWSGECGPASDQYSLAITYAELRQGRLPFKPGPVTEIMFAHLEGQYEFAPVVSEAERAVLRKALSRVPADRFNCCLDFVQELAMALSLPYLERRRGQRTPPPDVQRPVSGASVVSLRVSPSAHPGIHDAISLVAGARRVVALSGSVRLEFGWCPAGSFLAGSPGSEQSRREEEVPHRVRLTRGYFAGVHPVTRRQFAGFVEATGYTTDAERGGGGYKWTGGEWQRDPGCTWGTPGFSQGADHPVVVVSHNDAVAFARWVASVTGQAVRLLTEAEWEYAARGGTGTPFYWGGELNGTQANCNGTYPYDTRHTGSYPGKTTPVGGYATKYPHPWGLTDVIGNVWEWCADWYDEGYFSSSPQDDPTGPAGGSCRVLRGGGWSSVPQFCRAAFRSKNPPACGFDDLGFRLACEPAAPLTIHSL